MKKAICIVLVLCMITALFTACSSGSNEETAVSNHISEIGNHLYEYTLEDDSYWEEYTVVDANDNMPDGGAVV